MSELFVDTAGWVSLLGDDEDFHDEVEAEYHGAVAQKRQLVTSNYVLTEVVALLTSRPVVTKSRMIAFVDALIASPHVELLFISKAQHEQAWKFLKSRANLDWSLVDASSFILMRQRGITEAMTLDHHFEQAGFVRLPHP